MATDGGARAPQPRPFEIRRTTGDDWPLVRAFRIENAADDPVSYGATLEQTLAMTPQDWRTRARRGQQEDAIALVAIERGSGRWVGMMSVQPRDEDGPDLVLTGVYVTREFRGKKYGVADALLMEIVAWAIVRSDRLRLYVHEDAAPARGFYRRHRFVATGRLRPHPFAEGQQLELARSL